MGFGTRPALGLMRDGRFNVIKKGLPWLSSRNIYHNLITMSWGKFILLVFGFYFVVNLLFALLYVLIGVENLSGMNANSGMSKFAEAFFFSAQTLTTVGYGRISPAGFPANTISAIESLMGVLTFAIATGVLYGRFARPRAHVLYSRNAIIAPYQGFRGLMFRIANARASQLIEVEAKLNFSRLEGEGENRKRQFYPLKLERSQINFFPSSWTIVHPIEEDSPFFYATPESTHRDEIEVFLLFKGFDDTFSQTVYSRYSYRYDDIVWGAKFVNIFGRTDDGSTTVDLHRLNEFEKADLPEYELA